MESIQIGAINIQLATSGIRAVNLQIQNMMTDTKSWDVFEEIKDLLHGVMDQNRSILKKLEWGHYPYKAVVIAEKSIDFTSPAKLLLAISDKQDAINQKLAYNIWWRCPTKSSNI